MYVWVYVLLFSDISISNVIQSFTYFYIPQKLCFFYSSFFRISFLKILGLVPCNRIRMP